MFNAIRYLSVGYGGSPRSDMGIRDMGVKGW